MNASDLFSNTYQMLLCQRYCIYNTKNWINHFLILCWKFSSVRSWRGFEPPPTPPWIRHCRKMNTFSNETCLNVKHQPFIFQHIVQIYLNTYWYTPVRPYERRDCCDRWITLWNNPSARSFFINNTFSSTSKLLTPNVYCWSCKTLVTIYWTHLRVNGIWATSFCPEKMNNKTLFLTGCFQR